jgi:2-polyprenyl-3-methyl-5-hydroxy-6-metoxy-1,4-benzoquinol methylase
MKRICSAPFLGSQTDDACRWAAITFSWSKGTGMQEQERITPGADPDSENVRQHFARYTFASGYCKEKRVLDIACGTGYGSAMMANAGARSVLGVDISDEAVQSAADQYSHPNIAFRLHDAEKISLLPPVDLVVSFETIEHLQNPTAFLEGASSLLDPNGVLIISSPIRFGGSVSDKPHNPFHVREWTSDEFKQLVSTFFRKVEMNFQYNFAKRWYPYSRKVRRWTGRLFSPEVFRSVDAFPVLHDCGELGRGRFQEIYAVAICREPNVAVKPVAQAD